MDREYVRVTKKQKMQKLTNLGLEDEILALEGTLVHALLQGDAVLELGATVAAGGLEVVDADCAQSTAQGTCAQRTGWGAAATAA